MEEVNKNNFVLIKLFPMGWFLVYQIILKINLKFSTKNDIVRKKPKKKEKIMNQKPKHDKGITMVALVITIIVLLILASVSIIGATASKNEAKENIALSELQMVQHAALERYTKVTLTGEKYPGTVYTTIEQVKSDVSSIASEITFDTKTDKEGNTNYYLVAPSELAELGITNTEDTYIINYTRGEVINKTKQKTTEGTTLYVCAKE